MFDIKKRWNEFFILSDSSSIAGIVILGFVFLKRSAASYSPYKLFELLNHERIHVKQWIETGFIIFPIWYLVEYVVRRFQYGSWDKAYYNISFEREAFAEEGNHYYLSERKFWSFINYL